MATYQVDDADRAGLLAEEKEALAGLGGPGSGVAASLDVLLAAAVVGESGRLNGIGAEPEELLGVDEVPAMVSISGRFYIEGSTYLGKFSPLCSS